MDSQSGGNIYNIKSFEKDVEVIINDIGNYEELIKAIIGKDAIINCAASTSHSKSMLQPRMNSNVNSIGVINLLEAIRQNNRDASFVHLGTTTQLGQLHYRPADEFHPEFPTDIYSANKTVAEKYVLLYVKAYGINGCVIRLPNVYGPRAAIHSSDFTFNNYFIGLALQNKTLKVYKPGNQLRNVIFVEDVVRSLFMAMISKISYGETFFAVSDNHFTVSEIAQTTCDILGGSVELIEWPIDRKAIEVGDAIITNAKIKKVLRWKPKIELEEGLLKTGLYYQNCMENYIK